MSTQTTYPKILLVGRTNVGKSTIFNRLADDNKSIVFDRDGVTRDYVHEVITWDGATFDLIDTGGIPLRPGKDIILQSVKDNVLELLKDAALIVFVTDIKHGVCSDDLDIAKLIHKSKQPAIVVINKADNPADIDYAMPEFYKLGFTENIALSATHGRGVGKLLEQMVSYAKKAKSTMPEAPEEPRYKISLVGKPNVGKSSLLNILLQNERAIVSTVAGTTREPLSEKMRLHHELIQLTDTAGIRRKRGVTDSLETMMVKTSFKAIKGADLILLMVDGSEGRLSDQEMKLLFFAHESRKALILVVNKTDIIDEYAQDRMNMSQLEYKFIIKHIPVVNISCPKDENIGLLKKNIDAVLKRLKQKFQTSAVNEIIQTYLTHRPMYQKGMLLKVFKIRAVDARVPSFVMHVNQPEYFTDSHVQCIENVLRKNFDLKGCPVNVVVRRS
ncbi:ribosome biogenesis GTPase Der [Candidatus Babeliales bacterium]|nr:ribosome biogenesis GTPase Der [Candidatus Babeliales bacterium]